MKTFLVSYRSIDITPFLSFLFSQSQFPLFYHVREEAYNKKNAFPIDPSPASQNLLFGSVLTVFQIPIKSATFFGHLFFSGSWFIWLIRDRLAIIMTVSVEMPVNKYWLSRCPFYFWVVLSVFTYLPTKYIYIKANPHHILKSWEPSILNKIFLCVHVFSLGVFSR